MQHSLFLTNQPLQSTSRRPIIQSSVTHASVEFARSHLELSRKTRQRTFNVSLPPLPFVHLPLTMTMLRRTSTAVLALLLLVSTVAAFTTCNNNKNAFQTQLNAKQQHNHHVATFVASALLIASTTLPVLADEYGVETEAPTLFTGETVMVRFLNVTIVYCA